MSGSEDYYEYEGKKFKTLKEAVKYQWILNKPDKSNIIIAPNGARLIVGQDVWKRI